MRDWKCHKGSSRTTKNTLLLYIFFSYTNKYAFYNYHLLILLSHRGRVWRSSLSLSLGAAKNALRTGLSRAIHGCIDRQLSLFVQVRFALRSNVYVSRLAATLLPRTPFDDAGFSVGPTQEQKTRLRKSEWSHSKNECMRRKPMRRGRGRGRRRFNDGGGSLSFFKFFFFMNGRKRAPPCRRPWRLRDPRTNINVY